MLDKNKALFERDEKGELIPKEVELIGSKEKIRITPLTRGEFLRINAESKEGSTTKDQDEEIVLSHCVEPKFTKEEVKFLKTGYAAAIVGTILKNSGLSVENKEESDELKKP